MKQLLHICEIIWLFITFMFFKFTDFYTQYEWDQEKSHTNRTRNIQKDLFQIKYWPSINFFMALN